MDGLALNTEEGQNAVAIEIHALAHRAAKRCVRERPDQEDVAQDVVLHCLIQLREQRWDIGTRSLESHVTCLVIRRAVVLKCRLRRRMVRDMENWRDLDAGVRAWMEPPVKMDAAEYDVLHAKTLKTLTPVCRRAFELVRGEGLSYSEAAERLEVTRSTVKSHVLKAQAAFRSALRVEGIEMNKGWWARTGERRRTRQLNSSDRQR